MAVQSAAGESKAAKSKEMGVERTLQMSSPQDTQTHQESTVALRSTSVVRQAVMSAAFSSLRARLLLLVIVALLPALGLILYTHLEQRRDAARRVQGESLRIARLAAFEQDRLIEGARQLLAGLAQVPAVRTLDAHGCAEVVTGILKEFPWYANVAAAKPNGDLFCSAVPLDQPINLGSREYFQAAVKTRRFTSSGQVRGLVTGKPILVFAYPSLDESGSVRAVAVLALSLAWLNHLVADAHLPAGSTLTVHDRDAVIVARYPDPAPWLGRAVPEAPMVRAILEGRSEGTVESTGLDGARQFFGFTRLPTAPAGGELYLSVGISRAAVFAEANRMLTRNLVLLGLAGVLVLVAAWIASDVFVLRHVRLLVERARRMTGGDLGARTGLQQAGGELGELDRTLDQMAAAVAEREAKRTEALATVRASRETLREVVDGSPIAIYAFDREGMVTMWNAAAERMFGWTEEEVLGRQLPTVPEGKQHEVRELLDRVKQGEALTGAEVRRRRKDGSPIDLLISTAALRDGDGRFRGHVNFSIDITERKRTRGTAELLGRVGRKLAGTLNIAEVSTLIVSTALELLRARSASLYELGRDGKRLNYLASTGGTEPARWAGQSLAVGQGVAGLAVVEDRPIWSADFLNDPRVQVPEWLRERATAEGFSAVLAVPLKIKERVVGVLAVGDAAGRVLSEEEVRLMAALGDQAVLALENARSYRRAQARAEKLATLGEVMRLMTSAAGSSEVFGRIATAAVTLLGAKTARVWVDVPQEGMLEVQGGFGLDLRVGQSATEFPRIAHGGGVVGRVFTSRTPEYVADVQEDPRWQNRRFAVEGGFHAYAGIPLVSGDRAAGVLSILFGERRQFTEEEEELMQLLADQAAIAIEQSRLFEQLKASYEDLRQTQEQLLLSQKMEAIGRLAGGVAHDFNNLLTVITGRSYLLLGRIGSDEVLRRNIELIQKTGERAAALTKQLLAFSRRQILEPRVVDLNTVVEGMATMLKRLIGEDIDLAFRPGAGLWRVKADPGQLDQVIVNVAVNARDAMPDGGCLTLETANVELSEDYARRHMGVQAGPYVMLAVSDTGIGMDEATRARIFEPFFTTKPPGQGTGLGLATVYGIVKQSGGNIWVYSEPGKGTTFKVYLPRTEEAKETRQSDIAAAPGRGTETVLLVEDEAEVRALAREVLEGYGYTVLEAQSVADAIGIAHGHDCRIHLLLTDVVMPEMSGRALAGRLATHRPDMRVLYMSGYTDNAIVHHGRLDPGTPFIQKPFTPEALGRKVREVLDMSRDH